MDNYTSLREWTRRLEHYRKSGLSVREWCRQQGVSLHQYYYWRRRVPAACNAQSADGQWLAVDVTESATLIARPSPLTLRIAGAAIEVEPGFDPALLRAVVGALSEVPCSA